MCSNRSNFLKITRNLTESQEISRNLQLVTFKLFTLGPKISVPNMKKQSLTGPISEAFSILAPKNMKSHGISRNLQKSPISDFEKRTLEPKISVPNMKELSFIGPILEAFSILDPKKHEISRNLMKSPGISN